MEALSGRQYYVHRESGSWLELRERLVFRLVLTVLPAFIFLPVSVLLAYFQPPWVANIFLSFAAAGIPCAFVPGWIVADGARREVRIRGGLYRFMPRARTIPFDEVSGLMIWHQDSNQDVGRFSHEIWLERHSASSIKMDSSREYDYTNYVASSLADLIGVKAMARRVGD